MIEPLEPFGAARLANEDRSSSTVGTLVDLTPTFEMLAGHPGHSASEPMLIPSDVFERIKALVRRHAQSREESRKGWSR